MTLCPQARCGCAFNTSTLKINRTGDRVDIDMPDAYAGGFPIFSFANVGERDAELPAPEEGQECFVRDTDIKYRYTGSTWRIIRRPSTAFTPTLTGITLGTGGTNLLTYTIAEDRVHLTYSLVLGTGGALTGAPSITLPVVPTGTGRLSLDGALYDQSTGVIYAAQAAVLPGPKADIYRAYGSGSFTISSTIPFTWTNLDEIWLHGSYVH